VVNGRGGDDPTAQTLIHDHLRKLGAERLGQGHPRFFACKSEKGLRMQPLPLGESGSEWAAAALGMAGLRVSVTDLSCSLALSLPFPVFL